MNCFDEIRKTPVVFRGAGDLATASAIKLHNAGFPVIMLEVEKPTVIRTTVSFASCMFTGSCAVEGVRAQKCSPDNTLQTAMTGVVAVTADPGGNLIEVIKPQIVIDAILAKKNLGTNRNTAPFTIALGPGFSAPEDVNVVIETMRGHSLGTLIRNGKAIANTGIPGIIGGYGIERVLHSPKAGIFKPVRSIGDIVVAGDILAYVDDEPVKTIIGGKIRGMLTGGLSVPGHFKVADVDPRGEAADHTTCSDKARSIAGGVLEAVMHYLVFGE